MGTETSNYFTLYSYLKNIVWHQVSNSDILSSSIELVCEDHCQCHCFEWDTSGLYIQAMILRFWIILEERPFCNHFDGQCQPHVDKQRHVFLLKVAIIRETSFLPAVDSSGDLSLGKTLESSQQRPQTRIRHV